MPKFLFKRWNAWLEGRWSQKSTGKQSAGRVDTGASLEGESSQLPRNEQLGSNLILGTGDVQRQHDTGISHLPDLRKLTRSFEKHKRLRGELKDILEESAAQLHRCWQDYNVVAEEYMNRANQNGLIGDGLQNLRTAWEKLQISKRNLDDQEKQFQQKILTLKTLDDELDNEEPILYSNLQPFDDIEVQSAPGEPEYNLVGSLHNSSESSFFPPILQAYFNKTQQESFLRGRLHELQAEHREENEKRKLAKELNQPLQQSEKTFLETYFNMLSSIYEEYYTTRRDAMALKLKCRQRNLHIEDGEEDESDMDAFEAPLTIDKQLFHFAVVNKSKYAGVNLLEVLLFGYTDSAARVNSWVSDQRRKPQDNDVQLPLAFEVTTDINPPVGYSYAASITVEVAQSDGFRTPMLFRDTNFPGERPRHRYSDPSLYQRALDMADLPPLPTKRSQSIHKVSDVGNGLSSWLNLCYSSRSHTLMVYAH